MSVPGKSPRMPKQSITARMRLLIQAVQCEPVLWDTSDENYRNTEVKHAAWQKIARITGVEDPADVKAAWKNLRDGYRDALKRKKKNGRTIPWKHEGDMAFIKPHMAPRNTNTSKGRYAFLQPISSMPVLPSSSDAHYFESEPDAGYQGCGNMSAVPELPTRYEVDKKSALKSFFDAMFDSTVILPDKFQTEVKRQIFQIVSKAEEAYLDEEARVNKSSVTVKEEEIGIDGDDDEHFSED